MILIKRSILLLMLSFITISLLYLGSAYSLEEETFPAFGQSEIRNNDRAVSKKAALKECFTDAVRQYASKNMPEIFFNANESILKKKIYDKYKLYLNNYRIKEAKVENGFFKVTASVTLKTSLIRQKLKKIGLDSENAKKPSVLVLISNTEIDSADKYEHSWWIDKEEDSTLHFQSIHDRFKKRLILMGFRPINKNTFLSKLKDSKLSLQKNIMKGDIDTIKKLDLGDIIILGNLRIETMKKKRKLIPKMAHLSCKVVNLVNGSRLTNNKKSYNTDWAVKSFKRKGKEITHREAALNFIDDFTADLVEDYLGKWQLSVGNIKTIDLKAFTYSYSAYKEIKDIIDNIKPMVLNVQEHMMQKGSFTWKVKINGTTEKLSRKLKVKTVGKKSIEIRNIEADKIEIGLK